MPPLLEQAAARVADAHHAKMDSGRASLCVMHYVACSLAGATLPWAKSVTQLVAARPHPGPSGATMLSSSVRVCPADAVFANAVLGQSTLAEDLHPASLTHPGSMVVPAALAAAEEVGLSGRQLLSAVAVGYDIMCGIGTVLKTASFAERGFRPSGIFGPLGAAAAAAAVYGLDEDQAISALAIAVGTAAGLREWAHAGTTDVYLQNGFAARNGFMAAQLAGRGLTGPRSALDGDAGLAHALLSESIDWEAATREFTQTDGVRTVVFKRFPACSAIQGVLELAVQVRARHRIDPATISRVTIHTHSHGVTNPGCDNPGPFSSVGQAQMSNQLGVSLALHGERLDVESFGRHGDPSVVGLARRIRVEEDPEYTARYPGTVSARIVLETPAHVIAEELDEATVLADADVLTGVRSVLVTHFGVKRAGQVMDDLQALEQLPSVDSLLATLRTPKVPPRSMAVPPRPSA